MNFFRLDHVPGNLARFSFGTRSTASSLAFAPVEPLESIVFRPRTNEGAHVCQTQSIPHSEHSTAAPSGGAPREKQSLSPAAEPRNPGQPEKPAAATNSGTEATHSQPSHPWKKQLFLLLLAGGAVGGVYALIPTITTALNTISTDDAYVNGHVTFVAPRVAGQVSEVLVDDNMRVKKGSILVRLDKEPYQVKLAIKQAAVVAAEADLTAAQARVHGLVGLVRAHRFQLEHAIEDVNTKIADLRADVATLKSRQASLELARGNLKRGEELLPSGGISKEELETRRQTSRWPRRPSTRPCRPSMRLGVGLGLPIEPPDGKDLGDVPPDLVDDFSAVRQALRQVAQSAAELGYAPPSWDATPKEALAEFLKQDPSAKTSIASTRS